MAYRDYLRRRCPQNFFLFRFIALWMVAEDGLAVGLIDTVQKKVLQHTAGTYKLYAIKINAAINLL